MNRRVAALALALVALAGFLAWTLRAHLLQEKSHETGVLARRVANKKLLPPPPLDAPQPVTAAQYFDIAQHMLFSKDRNPTEVVEVKPPPPKPPLPPFPSYYGQVRLGEPVIFLGVGGEQNTYRAGDKVGAKDKFVIVAFDEKKITLGFNDEKVEKNLEDLRPKQPEHSPAAAAPAVPQRPSASNSSSLSGPASASSLADAPKPDDIVGAPFGSGYFACVAGDNSPDGTIKDGKKKVISHTMFGQTCHWETVR